MLDRITVEQQPNYPQHVHEHRAPTDESIKIYREMEDEIFKSILCRGTTRTPFFEATWCVARTPAFDSNLLFKCYLQCQINPDRPWEKAGEPYIIKGEIKPKVFYASDGALLRDVRAQILAELATLFTEDMMYNVTEIQRTPIQPSL